MFAISAEEMPAPRGVIDAAARVRLSLFDVGPVSRLGLPALPPLATPTGVLTGYRFPSVRAGDTVVAPRRRIGLPQGTLLTAITMTVHYLGMAIAGVSPRTITQTPTAQGAITNPGTPTDDGFVSAEYTMAFSSAETTNFPDGAMLNYVITGTDGVNTYTLEVGLWFVVLTGL